MAALTPALLDAIYTELWQLKACEAVLADPGGAMIHSGLDELPEGWRARLEDQRARHIDALDELGYTPEEARRVWEGRR